MKTAVYGALAIALAAAPAMANDKMHHGKHMGKDKGMMTDRFFSRIDTNNDGAITQEENAAFANSMFSDADSNNDGKVTKAEMQAHHEREHAKWEKQGGYGKPDRENAKDDMGTNKTGGREGSLIGTSPAR